MGVFPLKANQTKQQRLEIWPEFSARAMLPVPCWALLRGPRLAWGGGEGCPVAVGPCVSPPSPSVRCTPADPAPQDSTGNFWWSQGPLKCNSVFQESVACSGDLASLTSQMVSTGLFVLMAWLCPHSLCLKGLGRNRIGGDCLLGQAPKIKGVWATSGITWMQPVVGTFMWSFPLQSICGRLLMYSLCICDCGNERSLCLGPVICTGCWCSHGAWLCCWALPSSSLEEGKEKLDALRLVLPLWHKGRHYIRAGDICPNLKHRAILSLFILAPSWFVQKSRCIMAMSGWDMASSKKCSETSSQGQNCPKILKTGQTSAQSSSHVAVQRAHKNLPVPLLLGTLLVAVSEAARLGVKCCFLWHGGFTYSTGTWMAWAHLKRAAPWMGQVTKQIRSFPSKCQSPNSAWSWFMLVQLILPIQADSRIFSLLSFWLWNPGRSKSSHRGDLALCLLTLSLEDDTDDTTKWWLFTGGCDFVQHL